MQLHSVAVSTQHKQDTQTRLFYNFFETYKPYTFIIIMMD